MLQTHRHALTSLMLETCADGVLLQRWTSLFPTLRVQLSNRIEDEMWGKQQANTELPCVLDEMWEIKDKPVSLLVGAPSESE